MIRKLFVHIPKNAGMTIRRSAILQNRIFLGNVHKSQQYTQALEQKMAALGEHHGKEHARLIDIHPELRNNETFAIVRNPWDRVVSRYFFAKKVIYVEKNSDQYGREDYATTDSFEGFLEDRHKWGNQEFMWHRAIRGWYPALDYVVDEKGINRCDIMRFENLDEDLCKYFNLVSMTGPRNVTGLNTGKYQDVYTDKTIQIVADWYKKDIDYWGFDFDTGATKNYWNQF